MSERVVRRIHSCLNFSLLAGERFVCFSCVHRITKCFNRAPMNSNSNGYILRATGNLPAVMWGNVRFKFVAQQQVHSVVSARMLLSL